MRIWESIHTLRLHLLMVIICLLGAGCASGHDAMTVTTAVPATRALMPLGEVSVPPLEIEENSDGTLKANVRAELLFDLNSADLRPESNELLAQLSDLLLSGGPYAVRVDGYTDGLGDDDYNFELSTRRAESLARSIEALQLATQVQACGRGEEGSDGVSEDPTARRVVITLSRTQFPESCQ